MPVSLRVHEHRKVPGSDETRLVMTNPYIRLSDGKTALFIQKGQVWSAEGPALPLEGLPDWFWVEANKISKAALDQTRFEIPEDKLNVQNLDTSSSEPTEERRPRRRRA